jgi:cell division protein ZapA
MSSIAVRAGNIDATRAAVLACLHLADELESIERRLASLKDNVDHKARRFTVLLDEAMSEPVVAD